VKTIILKANPYRKKPKKRGPAKRIVRVKRNPQHRLFIVEALVRTATKRFKTYYYDGEQNGFTRERTHASVYSKSQATNEARLLQRRINPQRVYALRIHGVK
jgi:hypothetical protein